MELTEPIESINRQLVDIFGLDTESGLPIFRIAATWDQFEKRLCSYSPEGFQLLYPQVREVYKYAQNDPDYRDKYVLERLVVVPAMQTEEIPTSIKSYEPLYFFADRNNNPLPPKFEICKFMIDTLYAALGKKSLAKYVDEDITPEAKQERINRLMEQLYGDESFLLGRTITGEAVGYTGAPLLEPVKE